MCSYAKSSTRCVENRKNRYGKGGKTHFMGLDQELVFISVGVTRDQRMIRLVVVATFLTLYF